MFTDRPGRVAAAFTTVADRLPPQVRRGLLDGGLPVTDATDRRYRDSFAAMKRLLARLVEEGIPVVAGTDSMPGFTLHRELEVYVDAGVPAPKVLQIATLGAARVAGRAETLGSIEPGKLADLVLVEGDPTARISDVRNVRMVVRDGLVYDPAKLCAELGIRP
jgi:imidazolonepropionase-like amidohydrolase